MKLNSKQINELAELARKSEIRKEQERRKRARQRNVSASQVSTPSSTLSTPSKVKKTAKKRSPKTKTKHPKGITLPSSSKKSCTQIPDLSDAMTGKDVNPTKEIPSTFLVISEADDTFVEQNEGESSPSFHEQLLPTQQGMPSDTREMADEQEGSPSSLSLSTGLDHDPHYDLTDKITQILKDVLPRFLPQRTSDQAFRDGSIPGVVPARTDKTHS
ncbi:MAG TPA: hypothetical protein VFT30_04270 [Nitrospira sp.]|nr:hypothetical protein [Nitrospira sp.]